jgi:glycolate oxidase FAD binding subunit
MSTKIKINSQIFQDSNNTYYPKNEQEVSDLIKQLYKSDSPTEIIGTNSKNYIGNKTQSANTTSLSKLSGIIDYKPEELYIKVKACTPLEEIEKVLSKNNQELAFELIDFGFIKDGISNKGTMAGYLCCNYAGSRRFKAGSVRDHILGFKGVNGKGDIIKSGGTVVKNVTGYDLSKLISGSFGTLSVLTELSVKVLPKPQSSKTLIINNPHIKKAIEYLGTALSSSSDPSGGVFYPEQFDQSFTFNDLTHKGALTAIRIEGPSNSVDHRIKNLSAELGLLENEYSILESVQTKIFWNKTKNLEIFSNSKKNLLRIVVPISETLSVLQKMKPYEINYFLDWGGSLIWVELEKISLKILREIKDITQQHSGYFTIIKVEDDLKASADIFTIDPIKYKISEKIKKSFDPKRIFNPGKMYSGI